jgi:hypothetical protein
MFPTSDKAVSRLGRYTLMVLRLIPVDKPGISLDTLTELAFPHLFSVQARDKQRTSMCLDYATARWGIRIRRQYLRGHRLMVRIDAADAETRDKVCAGMADN